MANLKLYTVSFTNKEPVDGVLTITHPRGVVVDTPYFATMRYENGGLPTFATGLKKIDLNTCTVQVGECPNGTHVISIYYK